MRYRTSRSRRQHRRSRFLNSALRHTLEPLERRDLLSSVQLSIDDLVVPEDQATAAVRIWLSEAAEQTVTVDLVTADGTAKSAAGDYSQQMMTLIFPPGQTTKDVVVPIHNDTLQESDEQFYVRLSDATGATLVRSEAIVAISDDDAVGITNRVDNYHRQGGHTAHAGNLVLDVGLPGQMTLRYNSLGAGGPMVAIETQQPADGTVADQLEARFDFHDQPTQVVHFDTSELQPGDPMRFVFQVNAEGLATGNYPWTLTLVEQHGPDQSTRTLEGTVDVTNHSDSPWGRHWSLMGLDRLIVGENQATLVLGNGGALTLPRQSADGGDGQTPGAGSGDGDSRPLGLFENEDGTWVYREQAARESWFDAQGRLTRRNDRNQNTLHFQYDMLGRLATIRDAWQRETTFDFQADQVTITDFAGRQTRLQLDGQARLQNLQLPDGNGHTHDLSPAWQFSYDAASELIQSVDPLGRATQYAYDSAGMLREQTWDDGTIRQWMPAVLDGWVDPASGQGTQQNPAPLMRRVAIGTESDELQRTTQFTFDWLGMPLWQSQPNGLEVQFERDLLGRPTRQTITDPDADGPRGDLTTTMQYDERGNLIKLTLPDDYSPSMVVRHWQYDPKFDQVTRYVDELGRVTVYVVDPDNGNTTAIVRVVGEEDNAENQEHDDLTTVFSYTPNPTSANQVPGGLTTQIVDPRGVISQFHYQTDPAEADFGRQTGASYAVGTADEASESFVHDVSGNLIAVTDALGNLTQLQYDAWNRLSTVVLPDPDGPGPQSSAQLEQHYDAAGRLIAKLDALGQATQYEYNARDQLAQVTFPDPDGTGPLPAPLWANAYDAAGRLVKQTDQLGRSTHYAYDDAARRVDTTTPDPDDEGPLEPVTTQIFLDTVGNITKAVDAGHGETVYRYDARGNRTSILLPDPDGEGPQTAAETLYAYDRAGQLVMVAGADGNETRFEYDQLGRRITSILPDPDGNGPDVSPQIRYTYDAAGNMISTTDALDAAWTRTFDARGRVIQVVGPDPDDDGPLAPDVTSMVYDAVGNQTSLTDPAGNTVQWQFDALGRTVGQINSLGSEQQWQYDANGKIIWHQDERGWQRQFEYDGLQRLAGETWIQDGQQVHSIMSSYDAAGNLASVEDHTTSIHYHYDSLNRLLGEQFTSDASSWQRTLQYDQAGNLASLATGLLQDGQWTADLRNDYQFDQLGRVIRVQQSGVAGGNAVDGKRVDWQYDAAGRVSAMERFALDLAGQPSVVRSSFDYDLLGRIHQLQHTANDSEIAAYQWQWDAAGRIVSMQFAAAVGPSGTSDYRYDTSGQLLEAVHSYQADESFAYSANGNRQAAEIQIGTGNQLLEDGDFTYEYDLRGNRVRQTRKTQAQVADFEQRFQYDHRNRLVQIVTSDNDGAVTRQVDYDYDPIDRRTRKTIDMDGDGPAAAVVQSFVYDDDHLLIQTDQHGRPTHRFLHGPGADQVLADELVDDPAVAGGTRWMLTDHLGSVRDMIDHSGNVLDHITYGAYGDLTNRWNSDVDLLFAFTGRERDAESPLQYNRARYYDAAAGLWISQDPLGFGAGDMNTVRYVGNNPVNSTDPSGMVGVPLLASINVKLSLEMSFDGPVPFAPPPKGFGPALVEGLANQLGNSWFVGPLPIPGKLLTFEPGPFGFMPGGGNGGGGPGQLFPDWFHFTFGGGVAGHGQIPFLRIELTGDLDIGINPNADRWQDVFTIGISGGICYSVCSSFGLELGVDAHARVTDAPYVGALEGDGGSVGVTAGPISGSYITNNHGRPPLLGQPPLPDVDGFQIGYGVPGAGVYTDSSSTIMLHTGPDAPRVQPPRGRAGDGRQILNPGP